MRSWSLRYLLIHSLDINLYILVRVSISNIYNCIHFIKGSSIMYCALRLWTSPFSLEFYTVKRMLIFLHADETWHSTGNKVTLDLKKHNLFKPKKYRLRRNSATEAIHLAGKQILKIFNNEPFSKLTNWPVKVTTYGKIILETFAH